MGEKPGQKAQAAEREARLKVALKQNMARRKAQARARDAEKVEPPGDKPAENTPNENKGQ